MDVITRASIEYEKLGMWLLHDDNLHFVKALELKYSNDTQRVTLGIFTKWIDGGMTPVTWLALIDALQCVGLNCLAEDIVKTGVVPHPI